MKPEPDRHQSENHVVDKSRYWMKSSELNWSELENLVEQPPSLWPNGENTYYGVNDVVGSKGGVYAAEFTFSDPAGVCCDKGRQGGRDEFPRKTRARFRYRGVEYGLKVTDPVAEQAFQLRGDGEYPLQDVYLCVSLTEPYERDGRCYKIVAGVISPHAF